MTDHLQNHSTGFAAFSLAKGKTLATVLPVHKLLFSFALTLFAFISVQAQQVPGSIDLSFNTADVKTGEGFSHPVTNIALQSDGKAVVVGSFYTFNGIIRNRIARLNTDGSLDDTFDPGTGFNGNVKPVVLQSDGKVVVGGNFISYNGKSRNRIAQLNTDGSLDLSFDPGTGFNDEINVIARQTDDKVIAGGSFSAFNGTNRNGIARLHSNGSLDTSFNPGTGFNGIVRSITVQSDGKVVVGGSFTSCNGVARNGIVRLHSDGSLDATFNPGSGIILFSTDHVSAIAQQHDGKLIIGGNFSAYNGVSRRGIARLNIDGSLDTSFNPGSGIVIYASDFISSIALQNDGKMVVGGNFTTYNGVSRKGFARINADGSLDTAYNNGLGFPEGVFFITLQNDGKAVVGGYFTSYNGTARNYIARLHVNGSLDDSFSFRTGYDKSVSVIVQQSDGKLVAGGYFTTFHETGRNRITRLHTDGSLDNSFNPGTGFNNSVSAIALQTDGKMVVGGDFTTYNGASRNRIARLNTDGSLDNSFITGTGFFNNEATIALQSDGKIMAGGSFTFFNGTYPNRIARLNANGSPDASFYSGTGFNGFVSFIVLQSDGKAVVGGAFTSYNGTSCNRIIRLNADGSLDTSFNSGTGFNNSVSKIALQSDGKVVVGGSFTSYNGTARSRIARLHANGSLDTSFNSGTIFSGLISAIYLQSDGNAVVGGTFTTINNVVRNRIARLNADGTLDTSFNPGDGFNNFVYTIALQHDGKVVVGGEFTYFNGIVRNRIARLHGGDGSTLSTSKELQPGLDVLVYPNPGRGDIIVEFSGAEALVGAVKLTLHNAMGQKVLTREVTASEAQGGVKLATTGLASGVYFLSISTRSGIVTRRVVLADK